MLEQLTAEADGQARPQALRAPGRGQLRAIDAEKRRRVGQGDVAPTRRRSTRCGSARRCATSCERDAILVVDGQEILNFGRQSIPTYVPGHRLNSGAFGTMGVGLPFGVGAKVAKPDAQVLVLHGDGSFGINAMEIDTAVRHKIPVVVRDQQQRRLDRGRAVDAAAKPGRNLGYTRYDRMAEDARLPRRVRGEAARHPPRAGARLRLGQARRWSTSSPTTRRARTTVRFSAYTT